jgi:hypothetical protein
VSDDAVTQPGAIPGSDDPRVRQAVAVELQVQALRDLDGQVEAVVAVVRPFARLAEAGAALLEQMGACFAGLGLAVRGVWGGPIALVVVVATVALVLSCAGWDPVQVGGLTSETIRAARCTPSPAPPHTDTEGAVEAPAPAPQ